MFCKSDWVFEPNGFHTKLILTNGFFYKMIYHMGFRDLRKFENEMAQLKSNGFFRAAALVKGHVSEKQQQKTNGSNQSSANLGDFQLNCNASN